MMRFLERESTTESLDDPAFDHVNGSGSKADYMLGDRRIIAELKIINSDPQDATEKRLRERFQQPDAPLVFGQVSVGYAISGLHDRDAINKMMVDIAGRAVRRHLQKANEQIGAIKDRLKLPEAGGLVILMNDAEPMIDLAAIGYAIKSAIETVPGGYPHITHVWALAECHRIPMPGDRVGYGQLHVSMADRRAELDFMARASDAWARAQDSRLEPIAHRGDWAAMRAIYDDGAPTLSVFR